MTYSSYNDYCNNNGIEFSRMDKRPGFVVCGLCGLYMNVYLPNENKLAGIVKFRGKCEDCFYCKDCCKGCCTCYDYYYSYDILNNVKTQMFSIYKKKCCLSCSYDCCDEKLYVKKIVVLVMDYVEKNVFIQLIFHQDVPLK